MILVSGASATVDAITHPNLGRLYVPKAGNSIRTDKPWAIDNGAYSGFDEDAFLRLLERARPHAESCLFVAAPDVVGDAAGTRLRLAEWSPRIRALGFPVAYVLQDGETVETAPWHLFDAVFVGGSTTWKLGVEAARIVQETRRRGQYAHMGRVNTLRRLKYAKSIGCSSVDGTNFSMFPERKIIPALRFLDDEGQLGIEAA